MRYYRQYFLILFFITTFYLSAQNALEKTQVLILGTAHLSQIDNFDPQMIEPVLQRLENFDFDVICIEKMPGQLLYDIDRRNDPDFQLTERDQNHLKWADSVQQYQQMSFTDSENKIHTLLKKESLSDLQHKQLLYHYVATANIPSAVLQYKYLQGNPSLFNSEFDTSLMSFLSEKIDNPNEYYSMAVPLAFRSDHNIIEPIDNFQEMSFQKKYYPMFAEDMKNISEKVTTLTSLPVYETMQKLTKEGNEKRDLSALYSFLNSETYMAQDYDGQWQFWLDTKFTSKSNRGRYYHWEMRNLQIAANILQVAAKNPSQKILVIIGSSHKGYLEKFLKQVKDIEVLTY